jgi:hypothetical protein
MPQTESKRSAVNAYDESLLNPLKIKTASGKNPSTTQEFSFTVTIRDANSAGHAPGANTNKLAGRTADTDNIT